jgi:asparaginyl-tRNA synthetase
MGPTRPRDHESMMLFRRLLSTSSRLRPTIRQLLNGHAPVAPEETVQVHGWVKSVRRQKRVAFAAINDGSCASGLQAVFGDPELSKP